MGIPTFFVDFADAPEAVWEAVANISDRISSRYLVYTKDLRKDEQTLLIPVCMTMHL